MEKENRIGFLEQFKIACIKPSLYKKLLDIKSGRKWIYLLILILSLVFVEEGIPFAGWDVSVGGLKNFVENRIPEFTLNSSGLKMEAPIVIEGDNSSRIIVDSGVKQYKKGDLEEDYTMEILASESNVLIKNGQVVQEILFSSLGDRVMDQNTLVELLPFFRFMLFIYALVTIVTKTVVYLFWTLCFGLICRSAVRSPEGDMVTIGEAMELSFYAKTLPALLSSINVCLGYLINGMTMTMISIFLTMIYLYRAEFAVLKDRRLINGPL